MLKTKGRKVRKQEEGIALLISIFVLLIISAVGLAMVFAASTESSLAGNYKLSTTARYAALAGLEEGRGRMLPTSPNYADIVDPLFLPPVNTALATNQVRYIINPAGGEVVAPTNLGNNNTYPDREYQQEYNASVTTAVQRTINSVWPANNVLGPSYKWVRITPATERSLGIDVNGDLVLDNPVRDNSVSLFYDGAAANPSLMLGIPAGAGNPAAAPTATAMPVYEVTALAVVPGGGEKLLQYVVTAKQFNLQFPSALNLPGSNVAFNGANSNQWFADGQDGSGNPGVVPGCNPNPNNIVPAVGVTNTPLVNNVNNVMAGIPANRQNHYTGATSPTNSTVTTPSVADVSGSLNNTMQTPAELNTLVQTITQNADLVISGNATQANMPAGMSANNPMTVVVDGDFAMSGNFTGYGLLVVTGNFAYSGTTGWKGIVLVVGDGTTTFLGNGGGNNEFDGAMMVATIKDANGNLLPALGPSSFQINGGGGNGVYYNSCWINRVQQPPTYKMLSFREIQYND